MAKDVVMPWQDIVKAVLYLRKDIIALALLPPACAFDHRRKHQLLGFNFFTN